MRVAHRVDSNHSSIIKLFRLLGCSVFDTSAIGKGFPDIVVGLNTRHGLVNLLVEIKDGTKSPSHKKLTKDETIFFERWKGQACVVSSDADVLSLVDIVRKWGSVIC